MTLTSERIDLAQRELGRSVVAVNPDILEELIAKKSNVLLFGIKDTNQISRTIINRFKDNPSFAWLTIDKAANKGRAIDTDLTNPLTYRVMTGSTSGGPINILKGINDFAIGTDGGGSVLAPAISCQLPSVIGAGVELLVKDKKVSADGLPFLGSIGVIAKSISLLRKSMECMLVKSLTPIRMDLLRIVIPKQGSVLCPDRVDMHDKVIKHLAAIKDQNLEVIEVDMYGIEDRRIGLEVITKCFEELQADIIITSEGPVDVYGYGETIPQKFKDPGLELTKNHGKYLIRAANMSQTTAITIPTETLASGLVLIARKGLEHCRYAFELAQKLEDSINLPEVWQRYVLEHDYRFTGLSFY
ncbi:hypothetical protein KO561_04640 [Radiobacillus kanasensis]|uniref:hypothetical protein n=1 Tax=Radiobacillus kanasensis TaxID=2844358 RepID=UPI001E288087|nr:hypothetical protein [Radiobacillus kanasensis]UFU00245.1 hypothetical protein KO561_04640 [Radiobacillus kanasensis]